MKMQSEKTSAIEYIKSDFEKMCGGGTNCISENNGHTSRKHIALSSLAQAASIV